MRSSLAPPLARSLLGRFGLHYSWVVAAVIFLCLLAAAGVLLFDGDVRPQTTGALLFGGIIMMLLSACRSAWLLVVHELE